VSAWFLMHGAEPASSHKERGTKARTRHEAPRTRHSQSLTKSN
jgi:hypothetical protein